MITPLIRDNPRISIDIPRFERLLLAHSTLVIVITLLQLKKKWDIDVAAKLLNFAVKSSEDMEDRDKRGEIDTATQRAGCISL